MNNYIPNRTFIQNDDSSSRLTQAVLALPPNDVEFIETKCLHFKSFFKFKSQHVDGSLNKETS